MNLCLEGAGRHFNDPAIMESPGVFSITPLAPFV